MTETLLPLYVNQSGVYAAEQLSLPWADVLGEGVITGGGAGATPPTDPMKVTQTSPAGMAVQVNAGGAWVRNDATDDLVMYYRGGLWRCSRSDVVQVPVSAASPSNPRIDRVIVEVLDSQFSGTDDLWRYRVVAGTPAGSPSAPAEPRNAITLATVAIPAAASAVTNAMLTDVRPVAQLGQGKALAPGTLARTLALRPDAADWGGTTFFATDQIASYLAISGAWVRTSVPAGMIGVTIAAAASTGYLLLRGQAWPGGGAGIYADLKAALGNPATVPDFRGYVPVGQKDGDANFATLLAAVGAATQTLTEAQIPAHDHDLTGQPALGSETHTHRLPGTMATDFDAFGAGSHLAGLATEIGHSGFDRYTEASGTGQTVTRGDMLVANAGGGGAHPNIQPSLPINFQAKL